MKKKNLLLIVGLVLACIVILGTTVAPKLNKQEENLYRHTITLESIKDEERNEIYVFDLFTQSDKPITDLETLKANMQEGVEYLCSGMNSDHYEIFSIYLNDSKTYGLACTNADQTDGQISKDSVVGWGDRLEVTDSVTKIH